MTITPKAFANAFSVLVCFLFGPRVVASSNPGLELANAFGVMITAGAVGAAESCCAGWDGNPGLPDVG